MTLKRGRPKKGDKNCKMCKGRGWYKMKVWDDEIGLRYEVKYRCVCVIERERP